MRLEDCPPIPRPRTEDDTLAWLRSEHTGWLITQQLDYGGAPGAWHARRHDPRPALQGVRYQSAEELHAGLTHISETEAVGAR